VNVLQIFFVPGILVKSHCLFISETSQRC